MLKKCNYFKFLEAKNNRYMFAKNSAKALSLGNVNHGMLANNTTKALFPWQRTGTTMACLPKNNQVRALAHDT